MRIAVGNRGNAGGIRETDGHRDGLAAEMRRAAQFRRVGGRFKNTVADNPLRVREPEARMISEGLKKKIRGLPGQFRGVCLHSAGGRHKSSWLMFRKPGQSRTVQAATPGKICDKSWTRRIGGFGGYDLRSDLISIGASVPRLLPITRA
jgi:hypothetical protein